jgi:WD40 repeat protein
MEKNDANQISPIASRRCRIGRTPFLRDRSCCSVDAESVLALSKRNHTLAIVDSNTLQVVARAPVGPDPHEVIASRTGQNRTHMLYVTPDEKQIYTTNVSSATVSILEKVTLPTLLGNPVVFSPDSKLLASAGADQTVHFWQMPGRQPAGIIPGYAPRGFWENALMTFSPDGKLLAVVTPDGSVEVWDVAVQKPVGEVFKELRVSVYSITFSPNGKLLAVGSVDGTIWFWDVATRRPIGEPLQGPALLVWKREAKSQRSARAGGGLHALKTEGCGTRASTQPGSVAIRDTRRPVPKCTAQA